MARNPEVIVTVEIESGNPELDVLLEQARNHIMTPEEREAQRQSWVRGEMAMGGDRREQWVRGEMARGLTQREAECEWRERQVDPTPYGRDIPLRDERDVQAARAMSREWRTAAVKNKSLWLRLVRFVIRFLVRRYGI